MHRVVIDTNVLGGALIGRAGAEPAGDSSLFGTENSAVNRQTLFLEYEDVLSRPGIFRRSPLTTRERSELFAAFLSVSERVDIYFSWRPNLKDENDNHVVELAVAGTASMIVTNNVRDFRAPELRFSQFRVVTPRQLMEALP